MTDTGDKTVPPLPTVKASLRRASSLGSLSSLSSLSSNEIWLQEERNAEEANLNLEQVTELLTEKYTSKHDRENQNLKWGPWIRINLAKHYKVCVDYITITGENIFTILDVHSRYISSGPTKEDFKSHYEATSNMLLGLKEQETLDKHTRFLETLRGVQWAYYRTPPMPRLKFILREYKRIDIFFNQQLDQIRWYHARNPDRFRDASYNLRKLNFSNKYEIFARDTREKFLYRRRGTGVVKFACLLNNLTCTGITAQNVICKKYGILGTRYCYHHLQAINLKAKPSFTTPGNLAFFAWIPRNERTAKRLSEPVFKGPIEIPGANDPNFLPSYYDKENNPPEEQITSDRFFMSGDAVILEHVLPDETKDDNTIREEINENIMTADALRLNCGTPLNYLAAVASRSISDNDKGEMTPLKVHQSLHRRFAFVTARYHDKELHIYPLEDIYHGQELVLLLNNLYKENSTGSYGRVVHSGVRKGQSSYPLTPAQIISRVQTDQVHAERDKVYDISELKRMLTRKRLRQMN